MGKRKKSSRKPQGPKKQEKLATNFACLFCNHDNSVTVKLEKKAGTGELSCKVCGQHFQTSINYLSAAVDVYADWVDACDAVAKDDAGATSLSTARHAQPSRVGRVDRDEEDEEDGAGGYADAGGDGFIDDEDDPGLADLEAD